MAGLQVLLAGSTGLLGGLLLTRLLADDQVAAVVAATRRPLGRAGAGKLTEIPAEFARLALPDGFRPDVACCSLGTTIRIAGSQEKFRAVDHDAVLDFARSARSAGATRFVLVSSAGADPASPNFYMRVKGETERDLTALGFSSLHLLRPSLLLGDRPDHRLGEQLGAAVAPLIGPLLCGPLARYRPINASDVAAALHRTATDPTPGVQMHEYAALRRLAG